MADWYVQHLYKIYEAKFHEKFFRKSPLPQWVGWYNKYNQSFNYEVYDSASGIYVKRIIPRKFPDVLEVSFIDCNDFLNTGLCIYRKKDGVYWFNFLFGTNMSDRDDVFWTEPAKYDGISGVYYLYVHDVRVPWNNSRIAYLITDNGTVNVYAVDVASPGVAHHIDMSAVTSCPYNTDGIPWIADDKVATDIRLSKTAIEGSLMGYIGSGIGIHKCFWWEGAVDEFPTRSSTRIFSLETTYSEDNDDLMFKSNLPGTIWWRNRPSPGVFPPLDGEDSNDYELPTIPYRYIGTWASGASYTTNQIVYYGSYNYRCTSDHTSSVLNNPSVVGSPWVQFEWFLLPLGTAGYSYAVGAIATDNLEYEYVNWRTDSDREWLVGSNAIIVRTGGGFAYIMLA